MQDEVFNRNSNQEEEKSNEGDEKKEEEKVDQYENSHDSNNIKNQNDEETKYQPPEKVEEVQEKTPRDLEAEFTEMVSLVEPDDINVKEKIKELIPFAFNMRDSTTGLDLVNGQSNDDGEIYYGFMY